MQKIMKQNCEQVKVSVADLITIVYFIINTRGFGDSKDMLHCGYMLKTYNVIQAAELIS